MALVSGYASPLYDEALHDWRRVTRQVHDNARQEREEVLWISPRTAKALDEANRQGSLFDAL